LTFALTEKIKETLKEDRAYNVLLYGTQRIGKSSYVIQVLNELYGFPELKKYMCFSVQEFVDLANELMREGKKVPAILWDDAGFHLFVYEWHNKLVQNAIKLIEVVNIITASLIFTSPGLTLIVKKISDFEGIRQAKIVRASKDYKDLRKAMIYRNSIFPNGKRYIRKEIEDYFYVKMPDEIYQWYRPIRESYLHTALRELAYGKKVFQ
jgi:AAA+ ATPase superfamily predicted ATPase